MASRRISQPRESTGKPFLLDVIKIIRSEIHPAHIAMPLWSFLALSLMGKEGLSSIFSTMSTVPQWGQGWGGTG